MNQPRIKPFLAIIAAIATLVGIIESIDYLFLDGQLGNRFGGTVEMPLGLSVLAFVCGVVVLIASALVIAAIPRVKARGTKEIMSVPDSDAVTSFFRGLGASRVNGLGEDTLPATLQQTYIRAGAVPLPLDILSTYKGLKANEWPQVERLIVITRPLDINFAEYSLQFARTYREHVDIVISFQEMAAQHASPNVTLVRWHGDRSPEVLLTFPFLVYPATGEHRDDMTHGVRIFGGEAFVEFDKYFRRIKGRLASAMQHQSMADVVEQARISLWGSDQREYLRAIAISISDSLWRDELAGRQIQYTGLVGSVVNRTTAIEPRDIDVVLIFRDKPDAEEYHRLQDIVAEVCRRYSSREIRYSPVWESCPVKISPSQLRSEFPIHVLSSVQCFHHV